MTWQESGNNWAGSILQEAWSSWHVETNLSSWAQATQDPLAWAQPTGLTSAHKGLIGLSSGNTGRTDSGSCYWGRMTGYVMCAQCTQCEGAGVEQGTRRPRAVQGSNIVRSLASFWKLDPLLLPITPPTIRLGLMKSWQGYRAALPLTGQHQSLKTQSKVLWLVNLSLLLSSTFHAILWFCDWKAGEKMVCCCIHHKKLVCSCSKCKELWKRKSQFTGVQAWNLRQLKQSGFRDFPKLWHSTRSVV